VRAPAVFCRELRKDRLDHHQFFDARDDTHRAAARCAGLHIDVEGAIDAVRFSRGLYPTEVNSSLALLSPAFSKNRRASANS
jgi:hypothetical protein